ncbi:cell surface A33 antigen-like [Hemiscyllium ocellatum]|uniref:cell surface A33 antigen-like n=1 Tax=Hemiscyllium ocellatum TaxID=170820 RepID=UPI0029665E12|nr:cell surface A33 antigen-like [Hemiscyllium ocellatum]
MSVAFKHQSIGRVNGRMLLELGLVLCTVLTATDSANVVINPKDLEIGRGAEFVISCQYSLTDSDMNTRIIEWHKLSDIPNEGPADVVQYFGGIYTVGEKYKGRVNFTGNAKKDDCSIKIVNAFTTDSGTYEVEVKSPLGGSGKGRFKVTVLVPPSPPVCAIEGKTEYGQTVKLTCHSAEGSPKPIYSWKSFNVKNQPRQLPQMSSQEPGELMLKNLSAETSGFFICTSKNKIKEVSCNITLAVMPPSMNLGFYGGIIGGAIAFIVILGIIIYCCCCRDEKAPEDYEMGDPHHQAEYAEGEEDEELPERNSARRDHRGAYYDEVPDENEGENSPRPTVRAPLAPPNKPKYIPENHDV